MTGIRKKYGMHQNTRIILFLKGEKEEIALKKNVPVLVLVLIIAGIVAFHAIYEEYMYKREVQKVKETITHIAKQYDIPA